MRAIKKHFEKYRINVYSYLYIKYNLNYLIMNYYCEIEKSYLIHQLFNNLIKIKLWSSVVWVHIRHLRKCKKCSGHSKSK